MLPTRSRSPSSARADAHRRLDSRHKSAPLTIEERCRVTDASDPQTEERVTTIAALQTYVGREVGVGDWLTVTQERIDTFAKATGDYQWIHGDPDRCRAEGMRGTIAHGYLTLSLITLLRQSLRGVRIALDAKKGINYGSDRVRFITPVRTGARIRIRVLLLALDQIAPAIWQAKYRHTIEIEDEARPALVADTLNRIYLNCLGVHHKASGTGRE